LQDSKSRQRPEPPVDHAREGADHPRPLPLGVAMLRIRAPRVIVQMASDAQPRVTTA
jgi:hypothetical protein